MPPSVGLFEPGNALRDCETPADLREALLAASRRRAAAGRAADSGVRAVAAAVELAAAPQVGRAVGSDAAAGQRPRFAAQAADRLGFDFADRVFEREALAGDIRFGQRRIDAAQLRDQRGARTLVERPAGLAGEVPSPSMARAMSG